jgi:hypothetical protein
MESNACSHRLPFDPLRFGFVFSLQEMRTFHVFTTAHRQITNTDLDFPNWLAAHRAAQKEVQTP